MAENYGLALSGGGAKGAVHVGVLMALEEEGLLPERVAGTSAGSIVAGLYASGMEVSELADEVRWLARYGKRYLDPDMIGIVTLIPQLLTSCHVRLSGILKGNRLAEHLRELTGDMRLEDVPLGLLIPAVDLRSGDTVVYTNLFQRGNLPSDPDIEDQEHVSWEERGSLCQIMMGSSSVPAVFKPRPLDSYRLVDGGITNNLPVNLLKAAGEPWIIAVDIGADYRPSEDISIVDVAAHSFSIMSRELKNCRSEGERLLLRPMLPDGAGLLDFDCMVECMESGYTHTRERMPEIKEIIMKKNPKIS